MVFDQRDAVFVVGLVGHDGGLVLFWSLEISRVDWGIGQPIISIPMHQRADQICFDVDGTGPPSYRKSHLGSSEPARHWGSHDQYRAPSLVQRGSYQLRAMGGVDVGVDHGRGHAGDIVDGEKFEHFDGALDTLGS